MVTARYGSFQKKEDSQKIDFYFFFITASLEALDDFNNFQLAWTDAAKYGTALQKDSTCKNITSEQCFSNRLYVQSG